MISLDALGNLAVLAVLLAAYLPAVKLPLAGGAVQPRRDDIALSLSVVAIGVAVALTTLSGFFFIVAPPFFGFVLGVLVAGLVGRRPLSYGVGASAVYAAVVAGCFGLSGLPTVWFAFMGLAPPMAGAVGAMTVSGVWSLRRASCPG